MEYKKVILLTGGAGFIGSNLVEHMVEKYPEYQIINFDALTYAGDMDNLIHLNHTGNYVFVKGDIRDKDEVNDAFVKYGITDVIHMCAESHVDRSMVNPTIFVETNVLGTVNLLNAAREYWKEDYSSHRFFSMITDEIMGSLTNDDEPFNENTPLDPHSPYSTSKTAQYLFGKTYHEAYGIYVTSLSCGNAIGRRQNPEKLVPLTIDRIINREKIPIYGEGKQKRDWTNVNDIVDAIDLLFHKGKPELYCIGGDACVENIQIVHALIDEYARQTGADKKELEELITFIPDPRGKSHDFRYDINHEKITKELGWEPKYTFEDSVRETVKWYLENQWWVKNVKSGEYLKWIEEYYGEH